MTFILIWEWHKCPYKILDGDLLSNMFDEWICCNEMEPSQSHEKKPRGRERVEKRDSLSAVFCQGRNYTLTVFFSPKDGHHRSYVGIYEPISNMKYRHQESILPLFFTFSPLNRSQLLAFPRSHWSCFIYSQTRKIKGLIPWTLPLTLYLKIIFSDLVK